MPESCITIMWWDSVRNNEKLRKTLYYAIPALLVTIGVVAYALRDFVEEAILKPLMEVGWFLLSFYRAFSQEMWWVLAVFFTVFLSFRLLRKRKKGAEATTYARENRLGSRAQRLIVTLRSALRKEYAQTNLAYQLGGLLVNIEQYRRSPHRTTQALLADPEYELPETVQQFLRKPMERHGFAGRLWSPLLRLTKRSSLRQNTETIETVVRYLEERLEVQPEH